MAHAFATHARDYFEHGLAVLPVGGDDGKKPYISGFHKSRMLGPDAISKMSAQFPEANIGILPAKSSLPRGGCLAVVDIDTNDEAEQQELLEPFGPTPIQVRTGSGNLQAYYRSKKPINSRDFRHSRSTPLEVKCDGSYVVAPPSFNRKTGGGYEFISGSLPPHHAAMARTPSPDKP